MMIGTSAGRPLASIIVNNFNYARFVGDAIESALRQTYGVVEVIVVDDGSTDGSRAAISVFGGSVTPIFKANGGQGSAINAGFAASRGDVVLFLDADDILSPTAAERAVERLRDEKVVKAHWPMLEADAHGVPTGRFHPSGPLPDGDLRPAIFQEGPTHHPSPPTSGNAWSRRFLEAALPLPEADFRGAPDFFLCEMAPFFGELALISEPQSSYRRHGGNVSMSMSLDAVITREANLYEQTAAAIARRLAAEGVVVDVDAWRAAYWRANQAAAIAAIRDLPGEGEPIIYVDQTSWESGAVGGRPRVFFTQRDGRDAGPPDSDAAAIVELEALRGSASPPTHLVLAWSSVWWLEAFPEFRGYLEHTYSIERRTDELAIFDIRSQRR